MASDAVLVARLQLRRAGSWASRAFTVTGSDPSRDTTFMDRMYQAYAFLVIAASLALLWVMALAQIESVFSSMAAESAEIVFKAILVAASLAFGVMGVKAVERGPFFYSHSDVAYLVTGPIDLGLVLFSGFAAAVGRALVIGALAGFAFGVAAEAAGSDAPRVALTACVSLVFGGTAGAPWVIGAVRVFRIGAGVDSRSRSFLPFDRAWVRWLAKGAVALAAVLLTFLSVSAGDGFSAGAVSSWLGPAQCVAVAAEAALVFALGQRADSSAIAQEMALSYGTRCDMLTSMSIVAAFGEDAVKDERRRSRVVRRKPILGLPKAEGAAAVLARAALSVARQREGWPMLAAAGAAIAPFGAYAVSAGSNPVLLILWMLVLQRSARTVREIARPFADDLRLRTIRGRLPFRTRTLFVLDSIPGFAVAFCAQAALLCAAALITMVMGLDALSAGAPAVLLAPLTLVGMTECCAFDSARSFLGSGRKIGYELPAFLFSGVPSLMAVAGASPGDVLASVVVMDLALAAVAFDRVG